MSDATPSGDPSPSGDDVDRRTSLAGERTSMAGERTLLAWWRTGLTAIAVALGVGRLLPELAPHATRWPYVVLGAAFGLYGIAMFVLGTRRLGGFDQKISSDDGMLLMLMGAGVILGLGTLAVIVTQ
jgi:putative membrane protein